MYIVKCDYTINNSVALSSSTKPSMVYMQSLISLNVIMRDGLVVKRSSCIEYILLAVAVLEGGVGIKIFHEIGCHNW